MENESLEEKVSSKEKGDKLEKKRSVESLEGVESKRHENMNGNLEGDKSETHCLVKRPMGYLPCKEGCSYLANTNSCDSIRFLFFQTFWSH